MRIREGFFYVDENLYYLYAEKITKDLDDVSWQLLDIDTNLVIPGVDDIELPDNVTSDSTLWSTSDYGVYVSGSEVTAIRCNGKLYAKTTATEDIVVKGLYPEAVTSDSSILWWQTQLEVDSSREVYLIDPPSPAPVVITDDSLLPVDPIVYQQHRFKVEYFNDDYSEIVFNKPKNLYPDPDFSNEYAYSGTYSYVSDDVMGEIALSGEFDYTFSELTDTAYRLDVFFSGDVYYEIEVTDKTDSSTYTFSGEVSSEPSILRVYLGSYDLSPYTSDLHVFEHTGDFLGYADVKITLSGDMVRFTQFTPDIESNEFNNNTRSITIEYSTSEGWYSSDLDISPYALLHNSGFLVWDDVIKDTTSDHYTDFQCPIRDELPYAKCTGINKYHNISLNNRDWMTYPELEYRYGHDLPDLAAPVVGWVAADVYTTSEVCVVQRDEYHNVQANIEMTYTLTSDATVLGSIASYDEYTDYNGISKAYITYTPFSDALSPTLDGDVYYQSTSYHVYPNFLLYGSDAYIYVMQDIVETYGVDYDIEYNLTSENTGSEDEPILSTITFDRPLFDVKVYGSDVTSDASFTSDTYVELSYTDNPVCGVGEWTYTAGRKSVVYNTDKSFVIIKYKELPVWYDDGKIYLDKTFYEAVSSDVDHIAYDVMDTLEVSNEEGLGCSLEIVYRDTEHYYVEFFTSEV